MKRKSICYFSFRSPYAWLAMKRLEEEELGIGSKLSYIPYFEPTGAIANSLKEQGGEFLYQAMSQEKHLYIMGDVKRILAKSNIRAKFPADENPDWKIPHLIFMACSDNDIKKNFAFQIMSDRWLKGKNIWCWEYCQQTLSSLYGDVLATGVIQKAHSSAIEALAAEHLYSAYIDGVFGVPFMTIGRKKYWGQDRLNIFLEDLDIAFTKEKKKSSDM